ncbi:MAG: PQQ-dependent sugar dehydrogenase [Acidobacteria bacterium]|nr:MAG: PQQ-dependent sugar dehydrogenase [Acidobacteriota bacterium]
MKYLAGVCLLTFVAAIALAQRPHGRQTFAPHELRASVAPKGIVWDTPELPASPIAFESAEERELSLVIMTTALEQPWSMAFLPDGSMLITERPGRLRIVRNGVLDPTPVQGLPPVQTGGEGHLQGLMDVALHPAFSENKWIYFAYHKPAPGGEGATTLARATWNGTALVDVVDIFQSQTTGTEASRIVFGTDGMIYLSISGPGSGPDVARAQDPADYAGKIVRLREDGTIPADNPFARRPGYKTGIFTLGHRNGHGLAVNPETGDIWQTEQGPSGGDELNILAAGRNYGWPLVSYGRDYFGPRISPRPTLEGMEDPQVVWLPSIGLTGMTFYTGDRFPHWKRNVFVTGLREGGIPRTGQLQRIVFNDKWEELRREPMLVELKQRLRDVRQGPDGLLYVLTAEEQGALLRIEPAAASRTRRTP